jgi:3-oxoacyl-(acyl-carrier-protein) synthase
MKLTGAQDVRKMALFAQYAMVAAQEALGDAEWKPTAEEDLESTVRYILCKVYSNMLTPIIVGSLHWVRYWKFG